MPCRHLNDIALEVKNLCGVINITRLVQGNSDDVKGFRPKYWVIVYHSDRDWHVIEDIAEVIESDVGCAGAHLVEA